MNQPSQWGGYAGIIIDDTKLYDALEVHGVTRETDGKTEHCEVNDEAPEFYSVYAHLVQGGVECIGDFEKASDAFSYAEEIRRQHNNEWPISGKVQSGTIDLTPVGCQSPEGNARVAKATRDFQGATAQVANAAETMYYEMLAGGEFEDWTELSAAIQTRKEKQDAFLKAVAGRPEPPKETKWVPVFNADKVKQ